jgi:hypothetical protein
MTDAEAICEAAQRPTMVALANKMARIVWAHGGTYRAPVAVV